MEIFFFFLNHRPVAETKSRNLRELRNLLSNLTPAIWFGPTAACFKQESWGDKSHGPRAGGTDGPRRSTAIRYIWHPGMGEILKHSKNHSIAEQVDTVPHEKTSAYIESLDWVLIRILPACPGWHNLRPETAERLYNYSQVTLYHCHRQATM